MTAIAYVVSFPIWPFVFVPRELETVSLKESFRKKQHGAMIGIWERMRSQESRDEFYSGVKYGFWLRLETFEETPDFSGFVSLVLSWGATSLLGDFNHH